MNEIKALLLCNGPIAVPGIKEFLFHGKVAAIATPKRNSEMQHILHQLLKDTVVPLLLLTKEDYKAELAAAQLSRWRQAGRAGVRPVDRPRR